ncbi:MAG: tetratricopeptide repeat protein [Nannocystaceae bacterium]
MHDPQVQAAFTAAKEDFDAGRRDPALAALDRLLEARPDDLALWSTRGLWLEALGRRAEALAAFRRSTAIRPTYADHYNAGNMLLALGRPEEALAEYAASLACWDRYPEAWTNHGIAEHQLGRLEASARSFERALAIAADFVPALRYQAIVRRERGDQGGSEASYARIAELRPDDPAAWRELGCALGELALDRHLDLDPGGREWRALEALGRAIALAPGHPRAWIVKAEVLGRLYHANVAFRRFVRGRFEYEAGPLTTGRFHDEQLAHCEAAARRFPDLACFPIARAAALEFAGDLDGALEARRQACAAAPGDGAAHLELAFALADRDRTGALAALRRALALDPRLEREAYDGFDAATIAAAKSPG